MSRIWRSARGSAAIVQQAIDTYGALDVVVNRELASDLGVSMSQIAATTRALIGGEQAGLVDDVEADGRDDAQLVELGRPIERIEIFGREFQRHLGHAGGDFDAERDERRDQLRISEHFKDVDDIVAGDRR